MHLTPDLVADRAIDELVALQWPEPRELRRDDQRFEVSVVGGLHQRLGAWKTGLDTGFYCCCVHGAAVYGKVRRRGSSRAGRCPPPEARYDAAMTAPLDDARILAAGRAALATEAAAVAALVERLDGTFTAACRCLIGVRGRVVVTGMGKSGHVGSKVAATLASTGTPAFFLHPAEAIHGDLGMITRDDAVIALSNSGETAEVLAIVPTLRRLGIPVVALTGNATSSLATAASVHLDVGVAAEACPLNLAPTASTTATLAMGDALAVALLELRGFTAEDFARSHPGGSLGRRLLLHVADVMRQGDAVPAIRPDTPLRDGLLEMSGKGLGMTAVTDAAGRLLGVFTDGDLRRTLDHGPDLRTLTMQQVMTPAPKAILPSALAADAVNVMEQYRITALPVVDETGHLVGALNVHDLLRAGVM